MTDRTRNEKGFSQDLAGFAFILLGGFAAVSIVLFLQGQEPNASVQAFTWPVVALVERLGSSAALLFSMGLAGLGSALFLRTHSLAPWRPLAAITAAALGLALILGAVECGGSLGAWLPGLLVGFAGRAIGAVLGLALAWLGWTLFTAAHSERLSAAETVQRLGLSARHESAAGVSPAEAALLVTEPRATSARVEEARPVRVETLRPFPPTQEAPAAEGRRKRVEGRTAPLTAAARPFTPPMATPLARRAVAEDLEEDLQASGALEPATLPATPPVPSWEQDADEPVGEREPLRVESSELAALERDEADTAEEVEDLAAGLAEAFELEAALGGTRVAEEDGAGEEEDEESGDAVGDDEPLAPATPAAAWEQVGLFDEDEELEESSEPVRPAKVELTPSFDFESAEPKRRAHEPEPVEDPFAVEVAVEVAAEVAAEPAPVVEPRRASPKAARAVEDLRGPLVEVPEPESHREVDSLELQPVRAAVASRNAQPEPPAEARVVPEEGDEAFAQLVFEAGCAILEQKRVAVSMLERRFQVDFDKACRVLDELQEAGLIGPYIGGRTRDILLTREEWLAHAPHAS